MEYNFREIEQKWQQKWVEEKTYQVAEDKSKPKFYVLNMFPYPSGAGLHVGHPLGYIASDIYARFKRLQGYNVLNPMGYDAYGLPAEQYAIQTGQHPEKTTFQNIDRYREQLDKIGFCFDWDREVRTCAPGYYKWTQWAFQKMFGSFFSKSPLPTSPKGEESHPAGKARPIEELVAYFDQKGTEGLDEFGVAQTEELHFTAEEWKAMDEKQKSDVLMNYRIAFMGETMVNWCAGLGTVLANDEVVDGVSVRGGFPVEQKKMRQWCLRVSAYAQRLLDGLDTIEWSDSIKETQKNWIGRSEGTEVQFKIASPLPISPKGEESHAACSSTENLTANNPDGNHSPLGETEGASFTIFTTRADTMFGVTFMVLAPESELVEKVTTAEQKAAVEEYIKYVKGRTERERMIDHKVTGVFSGSYAINPFTGEKNPIWISEYVLAGYGTGAIMAVPAHDSRDYAFAKHFGLPIIPLIEGADVSEESYDAKEGIVTNSPRKDVKPYIDFSLNGLTVKEAIAATKKYVKEAGIGRVKVNYRLRDAIFSRQRYWGEPFPVYYKNGIPTMIPEECLPIELPEVDKFLPTETGEPPLGNATVWAWDEVNKKIVENSKIDNKTVFPIELYTMPGFAGSSAYYLRYMDPHNDKALVSKEADEYWQNVDLYVGGSEHATGHLIYSRFWNKFLFDMGVSCKEEPFQKLINQGMIQGRSNFVYRIKDTNTFVTLEKKDQYDVTPIHVDVNIVSADVLDVEAFKAWRPEYNTAEFILNDEGKYVCGWAVEKMSKSMFNVVNPDMIVEKFGADTLRLYEMFLGPVEQSKPWDTNGIDGCHRFLKKLWKFMTSPLPLPSSERALSSVAPDSATFSCPVSPLATPKGEENHAACSSTENQTANNPNGNHSPLGETVGASKEELKALHTLIKKETADIEAFSYNTTIAAFMVCLNELTKLKSESREVKESLAILLAPFCPHLAEEFWHLLGHDTSVCDAPWPAFNEDYLKEDSVKMMVAFNGKARFPLEFPADVTKEEAEKAALADPQSAKWMEGFTVAKVIVVPGKMINVVLKK
ncbi:MAG: leucine--tRNA ligase [Bacteroidaceae bacterium]|nr:leucine--tRNA ligase [Prevotellaceae bacterium]MDY5761272.1 leucine--tRNA ligase [Bacteroidaceae bacterium]